MATRRIIRRNIFTDEIEEVEVEDFSTRAQRRDRVTQCFSESRPHRSLGLACHPSQVNEFNEIRQKEGRGNGGYRPDGVFECYSKKALNDELIRRGVGDGDAGYSDVPPPSE